MHEQINPPKRLIGIAAGIIKQMSHVPDGLGHLVDHITFGSFTLEPCDGNKEPVYFFDSVFRTSYNAVGLKNMGLREFIRNELIGRRSEFLKLKAQGCHVRISLAPRRSGDLTKMVLIIIKYWEMISDIVDEIEVNGACPNHRDESGCLHAVLAKDPVALETLMAEGSDLPGSKSIKIAPNTEEACLAQCVNLAHRYVFRRIVSGNTQLTDTPNHDGRLCLTSPTCGKAGAPLLDDAVEQVKVLKGIIAKTLVDDLKIVVIGCGGIMGGADARRHLDAGADVVQVATYFMEYGYVGVRDLVASLM
jgi:dihydroorotate dehydrogenase